MNLGDFIDVLTLAVNMDDLRFWALYALGAVWVVGAAAARLVQALRPAPSDLQEHKR